MDQNELCSVPALARRAASHDPEAIEMLWCKVKRLAYSVARRYAASSSVDIDDLLQCAFFAMLDTVQSYDEEKNAFILISNQNSQQSTDDQRWIG